MDKSQEEIASQVSVTQSWSASEVGSGWFLCDANGCSGIMLVHYNNVLGFLILVSFIDQLGMGGAGYVWSNCEGQEEAWKHSVAPIPADKISEAMKAMDDDLELIHDDSILPASGELKPDSNASDDDNEDSRYDSLYFEKEVRKSICIV